MKIHVNRIPVEGLHEEAMYDPRTLDIDRFDVHLENPITVSSFITKVERELVVDVEISCQIRLVCARCLGSFESSLHTSATLNYQVMPTDTVDITDDIRQEIILAYPMIPVCQQGCKGLCSVCGQNLNQEILPHKCSGKISD